MVQSNLDLDLDGKLEFLIVTAWSSTYYNTVYLYEATQNNNYEIVWSYSFYPYSNDYGCVTVADLNGNGRKEIICLIDPVIPSYHGLYIFEWDGSDNGFPATPTGTSNFGVPNGFDEGTAIVAADLDGDGRDEIALSLVQSWTLLKSRLMIFSLSPGSPLTEPQWTMEFVDSTTFSAIGYCLAVTDLDRDNRKEIIAVGWEPLHVAIYENLGVANSYARVANITGLTSGNEFSNMGLVQANFDNNATNELYMVTAGGRLFVVTNPGNVSMTTSSNFYLIHQYDSSKGIAGLSLGDIDSNLQPELYVAGSYHEAVFQWKYLGGAVTSRSSYSHQVIFQDDTLDSHTPGSDQGYLRPSKVSVGDLDRDGSPDIVIASASFARDKPVVMVVEQTTTGVGTSETLPKEFAVLQNYPNPFNPLTSFEVRVPKESYVSLSIFDVLGREVASLIQGTRSPGTYRVQWDASGFPSGVYLYRLEHPEGVQTNKMVLLR
jgi:hypothetical protein